MADESGIAYLSFTERGAALAERLRASLGGVTASARGEGGVRLAEWTAEAFATERALVYVGAVGIAVRAVAPHLVSKTTDPAVVAVDDHGQFVVPLASGHLGGANDLARRIAAVCGGTAVVTTATDLAGVFAVDEWAKRQDCAVIHPRAIKAVSGKILSGGTVRIWSAWPIGGRPPEGVVLTEVPEGADVYVDVARHPALSLAPRIVSLGIGCRRGTTAETLEARFDALFRARGLWTEAVRDAATIDVKGDEPGLLTFCDRHGWPLRIFSAEDLRRVPGTFRTSAFVERTVGVGCVCERAAALAVRDGAPGTGAADGTLLIRKDAGEGVTFAAAVRPYAPGWQWRRTDSGPLTETRKEDG